MALSAFDDKSKKPQASDLEKMLSRTSAHWQNLIAHIASEYPPLDETWGFAGANWGWSLRLRQKKRTVLYMTPCKGYFLVGFVLGEKALLDQDGELAFSLQVARNRHAPGRFRPQAMPGVNPQYVTLVYGCN